jgi:hypothetical protein
MDYKLLDEIQKRRDNHRIIVYIPAPYDAPSNNPEIKHLEIRDREES